MIEMKRLIGFGIVVSCCILVFLYIIEHNDLLAVTLTSPRNTAMYNRVDVSLAKPAPA